MSVIEGRRFDWERGDMFVVPLWAWHEHVSSEDEGVLFSIHDSPVMESLCLYMEEAYDDGDGHQEVMGVFA
jgi:gentisate 1,2-dioxygenase